jgi:hypothetical protein
MDTIIPLALLLLFVPQCAFPSRCNFYSSRMCDKLGTLAVGFQTISVSGKFKLHRGKSNHQLRAWIKLSGGEKSRTGGVCHLRLQKSRTKMQRGSRARRQKKFVDGVAQKGY